MKVCTPSVKSRFGAVFLGFRWLLAVGGLLFLGIFSTLSAQKVVYLDKTTFKLKNLDNEIDVVLKNGANELAYLYTSHDEIGSLLERTKSFLSQDFLDETAFNLFLREYLKIKPRHLDDENFVNYIDALVFASEQSIVLPSPQAKKTEPKAISKPIFKEKTQSEITGVLAQILWLLLALTLLLIGFFISKKSDKTNKKIGSNEFKSQALDKDKTKNITSSPNEQAELARQRRDDLEAENKRLESVLKYSSQAVQSPVKQEVVPPKPVVEPVVSAVEIAYFPISVSRYLFYNEAKSLVPLLGYSFYLFKINPDKVTATFQIWDNPDALKLLIDKGLNATESFCEFVNKRTTLSDKIVTLKVGEVELKDNKWLVKTKSVVEYLAIAIPSVKTAILATPKVETTEIAYFSCPINERVFNNSTKLSTDRKSVV